MIYFAVVAFAALIAYVCYLVIKPEKDTVPPPISDPTISIWWDDEDRAHTEGEI